MYLRSFDGTTIEEVLRYVGYQGAAKLRARVTKLASEHLGEGDALAKISEFMRRSKDISERRNDLLHSPIARERDGQGFRMRARGGNNWVELPQAAVLQELADETFELLEQMNHERLNGIIGLALSQRTTAGQRT
jgi:hypothetical protein